MNLSIISEALKDLSRLEFDAYIESHFKELTAYFYGLSVSDLHELEFDQFCMVDLANSPLFIEFDQKMNRSAPFDAFLELIAVTAEKIAEIGLMAPIDYLVTYLPESSVKFRLKALSLVTNINDFRKDYINVFHKSLELLFFSDGFDEQSRTHQLVDFLIYYYNKASEKLGSKYPNQLLELTELFKRADLIEKYYFLGHTAVQQLVRGHYAFEVFITNVKRDVLYPSDIIESLFRTRINKLVLSHPNSDGPTICLGYNIPAVLNDILERGRTDFNAPYKELGPEEKVLLYCYFNMKKHFFTSYAVFQRMKTTFETFFADDVYEPIFIDLGCGPLTSGLALADLMNTEVGKPIKLTYIGIDIAKSMLNKALEFSKCELFDKASKFFFFKSWDEITLDLMNGLGGKNAPILINASYLFASKSLNPEQLVAFVKKLGTVYKNLFFLFQNPDRIDRNIKYEQFKGGLEFDLIEGKVEKIAYKTKNDNLSLPAEEDVYYEILAIKS